MESTIRLFKGLPVENKKKKSDKKLLEKTIRKGFVFAPEVIYNYPNHATLIGLVEKSIGITPEQLNQSFHKSWAKIKDTDMEQLVVEQIAHYLTTYGKEQPEEYIEEKGEQWGVDNLGGKIIGLGDFESDKIKDANYIYIPKEKLEIPDLDIDEIKLVVIRGYTKKELKEKLLVLLSSGIALGEDTLQDVLDVATFVELDVKDIDAIKNKEAKTALYDYLNLVPENPTEFLRFAVYKAVSKTLLIKNSQLINEIKETKELGVIRLFSQYEKTHGLEKLAEVFYRFKPLFLAFRTSKKLKVTINRIRRLAVKNHKPMPEDYLNTITEKLLNRKKIDSEKLEKELDRVNVFRKIRLAYALKFRTKDVESILYKIRNGKGYAKEFSFENQSGAKRILKIVMDSIVKDVKRNVKGKKIYIPEHMNYSLPSTEKQFTGYFPSGTYVSVPKDIIFGIHWKDTERTVDLDLSLILPNGDKIGWDSDYRTEGKDILFSGDITSAPQGATELFYVRRQTKKACILFVNYYNFEEKSEVPFKIIVAKEQAKNFGENYTVNPNNVMAIAESKINERQKILGLLVTTTNECRFYFTEAYMGKSITSKSSDFADHSRQYLFDFYENSIELSDILTKAGAKIVTDKDKSDIDLSPEELQKDSIINLIK